MKTLRSDGSQPREDTDIRSVSMSDAPASYLRRQAALDERDRESNIAPTASADLQQGIDCSPIALCIASLPDGKLAWVNKRFEEIMGRRPELETGVDAASSTYQLFDRAGRPYPKEKFPFCEVVRTGLPAVADDIVIHLPDGNQVFVRAYAHPVLDSDGDLRQVSIALIDITREVLAGLERDDATRHLRLALEHAPILIWGISAEGTMTLAQGAGLRVLEEDVGPLLGRNIFEVFREDSALLHELLGRAVSGECFKTVVHLKRAVLDTWIMPALDSNGAIVGATGLAHDVRELRQLEAAAMQGDRTRVMGLLSASVAHEINNPLTYMLPCCENLAEVVEELTLHISNAPESTRNTLAPLTEQLLEDVNALHGGIKRIAAIASDLRTFTHSAEDRPVPIDLSSVVRSVLQLVGKELSARTHVVLELNADKPVLGHSARLVQVILNLITNAMQALNGLPRSASKVTIRSYAKVDAVVLEVGDSGAGVAQSQHERIFEPFVTSKRQGEGTGLGLFISRNIVQQHGGSLTVHTSEDGGALFRMSLPRYYAVPASSNDNAQKPEFATDAAILIIDDEVEVGKSLQRQLRAKGYAAEWFPDVAAAVFGVTTPDFDFVFCDLMMQDVEGRPWYDYLSEKWPHLTSNIIVMTGGAFSPLAREFAMQNAERLVEKPFDIVEEVTHRSRREK